MENKFEFDIKNDENIKLKFQKMKCACIRSKLNSLGIQIEQYCIGNTNLVLNHDDEPFNHPKVEMK